VTTSAEKYQHLMLIQSIITRMAANSFALKSLSATLSAAVLALIGASSDPWFLLPTGALIPTILFWFLDAKYLTLEQKYRDLYEDVRKDRLDDLYSLNYEAAIFGFRRSDWSNFFSWSVLWFYGSIATFLVMVAVYL